MCYSFAIAGESDRRLLCKDRLLGVITAPDGAYAGGQTEGRVNVDGARIEWGLPVKGRFVRRGLRAFLLQSYCSLSMVVRSNALVFWPSPAHNAREHRVELLLVMLLFLSTTPHLRRAEPSSRFRDQRKRLCLRSLLSCVMAALSISARSTLCPSCIRRIAGDDISQLWFPFQRQLRGKKKSAKPPTTINVKLLEDITGFGRKGNGHRGFNICQSVY